MIEEQALRLGSGGDGAHRGGLGFRRAYRVLAWTRPRRACSTGAWSRPRARRRARRAPFRITLESRDGARACDRGKETLTPRPPTTSSSSRRAAAAATAGRKIGSAELKARDRTEGEAAMRLAEIAIARRDRRGEGHGPRHLPDARPRGRGSRRSPRATLPPLEALGAEIAGPRPHGHRRARRRHRRGPGRAHGRERRAAFGRIDILVNAAGMTGPDRDAGAGDQGRTTSTT